MTLGWHVESTAPRLRIALCGPLVMSQLERLRAALADETSREIALDARGLEDHPAVEGLSLLLALIVQTDSALRQRAWWIASPLRGTVALVLHGIAFVAPAIRPWRPEREALEAAGAAARAMEARRASS